MSGCLFRHSRYILTDAVCQCGNSSQSLNIQVELQPEEIHKLPLPALLCHNAQPVTNHALKLCHTLLGTRVRIQIGKGKSATPQVIKPAAWHLSKLTHASMETHKRECTHILLYSGRHKSHHDHTSDYTHIHMCGDIRSKEMSI